MGTIIRRNERSWAIVIISEIKVMLNGLGLKIKSAGGESTLSVNKKSMFPDVLLYEDEAQSKTGHIAIFDRTWYGRVMVERLEGFCSENEWQRAYNEINEFEKELSDWGAVIIKFWVQIDKDTQLARFEERQNTPEKQWKITDEDWRNREKWDLYETAVNEMLKKTNTTYAPWHVLESNDKKYARIKALKIVIDAIEAALDNETNKK